MNQLTSASNGATLTYDAVGRLYSVTAGSATTRFAYDNADIVAEYDGSGNLLRRFVHGPGADEPLVWYEGNGTGHRRWFATDNQGSVVAITDSNGSLVATNSYDEYGVPGSANQGRFQYTGQAWISEIGLYYYKARVYAPNLGRFFQTDPAGYVDGPNRYAYVGNDPVNGSDPTGLAPMKKTPLDGQPDATADNTVQEVVVTGHRTTVFTIPPAMLQVVCGGFQTLAGVYDNLSGAQGASPQNKPPQNQSVACQVARDFDQWAKEDAQTAWGAAGLGALSNKLPAPLIRGAKGFLGVAEVFGIASTFESGASAYINGAMSGDWSKAAAIGAQKFISNASGAGGFVGETAGMLSDQVSDRMMKGPCD